MRGSALRKLSMIIAACLLSLGAYAIVAAQRPGGGPPPSPGPRAGGDPANVVVGKATAIGGDSITVELRDGSSEVIKVTSSTRFVRNRKPATLADFKVDDFIAAHGSRDSTGQFTADHVGGGDRPPRPGPPPPDPATRAFGKVTEVGSASLTLEARDGSSQVVNVTSETRFVRNREPATLVDFQVDDHVMAHGSRDASGQFTADHVVGGDEPPRPVPPRPGPGPGFRGITGRVESVDVAAGTITVVGRGDRSQVVYTTDRTRFVRNRQPATLSDFQAGDHVAAEGRRNPEGRFMAVRVVGGDRRPGNDGL